MALSKAKKNEVVQEVSELLSQSKMTVVVAYKGTPVKALQDLRRQGRESGTTFKVIKNRLVVKAAQNSGTLKGLDTSALSGMLLYAFNAQDEAAPAQTLASFARSQPSLQFVGAITPEGSFMSAEDVTSLASLPGKDQLRSMLVGTIGAPLSGLVGVLNGNLRGFLNVLSAKAELTS